VQKFLLGLKNNLPSTNILEKKWPAANYRCFNPANEELKQLFYRWKALPLFLYLSVFCPFPSPVLPFSSMILAPALPLTVQEIPGSAVPEAGRDPEGETLCQRTIQGQEGFIPSKVSSVGSKGDFLLASEHLVELLTRMYRAVLDATQRQLPVTVTERFSVRFKEGSVDVTVIEGPGGGANGKLSCKKKGTHCLEVTV
ncbi:hypothetical protein MC885_016239, partial [Smutsia gigantea]